MADRSRYVSKPQLAGYLRQAGFSEEMIPTMIGISTAESSLDTKAFNPNVNTGDQSYGLFQINMLGAMGPERRALFGIKSNEELFDPLKNAKAAKAIYDQQGLGAWSVYKSGKYSQYVPGMEDIAPPSNSSNTTNSLMSTNAPQRQTVDQVLSKLRYDPAEYRKTDNKATSLRDQFVNSLKEQIINNVLNPLGGFLQ
jgi:hypothetical protein